MLLAHVGGSVLWVFSTVLLQMEVPDQFRGRAFAADLARVTLLSSRSSDWTGRQFDHAGWSPRALLLVLGLPFFIPGAWWTIRQSRGRDEPSHAPEHADATISSEEQVLEGRVG